MQPLWLCIISGRSFEDTHENTHWRKVKQMQPVWLCILLCNKCDANAYAYANASSYAINVIIHHLWQTVWGDIWRQTVEKSPTNVYEDFWTKSHCCDVWELFKFLDNKIISNERRWLKTMQKYQGGWVRVIQKCGRSGQGPFGHLALLIYAIYDLYPFVLSM